MLRTVKNEHILPILQGVKITTTAVPGISVDIGDHEVTATRAAAGRSNITLLEPLLREGAIVASPGAAIASGGLAGYHTDHTGAIARAMTYNAAGAGDDGTVQALLFGFEHDVTDTADPLQAVKTRAVGGRVMGFRVSAAGAAALGASQASVSLAASIFTLAFENDFQRSCVAVASPIAAAAKAARITAATATGCAVETYDPVGGALEDNAFYLMVFGWDSPDIMGGMWRSVKCPQIGPRMEAFRLTNTGGVETLTWGNGSLVQNGVGDYSITFNRAFAREPIVLCTAKTLRAQNLANATSTGCQIGVFDAAAPCAANDDDVYVLVLGYDGEVEI